MSLVRSHCATPLSIPLHPLFRLITGSRRWGALYFQKHRTTHEMVKEGKNLLMGLKSNMEGAKRMQIGVILKLGNGNRQEMESVRMQLQSRRKNSRKIAKDQLSTLHISLPCYHSWLSGTPPTRAYVICIHSGKLLPDMRVPVCQVSALPKKEWKLS